MTVLNIEWKDKYTAGDGIQISPNKVISLLLKESPNLLKLNENGELYCDLQTITNPTVNTVFDTWITTGYVEPSGWWPEAWQILMCKTTTGVHFCILKGDDDKLYYTSDPRDGTSWSHILRDDDLDALMDTLKDYIDEQFEHLEGYVKITSCKGVRESNHYMVKNIYTDADQNGVTLSLYRRDLKGELPNDLISEITFPVADEYHAGIITAEVYNQIQSNTARILALEWVGWYIGVYPTIAERPTNVSQLPAEVTDPKPKDYIKIASDTNFRGQSSIYTITAINSTTGAITWDSGYASVSTLNYRIYDTIAERDAELNVYDGLACFVVATGKKYTYTTNDGWTADVCDYDDLTDKPIVNITGSLDNVLGEDNKTTVYNNGDGTRIVVSRAGQTSTQVIERKDWYSTRTTTDEGQTRSAWTNVEFESGIKWDKVIISATEPVDKVVTTPWLDTRDESLNVWNGVRWIKIPNTIQKSQLPTASQSLLNVIYQYVGSTNTNYTNGYFYKCVVDDPEADPVTYKWEAVKTQSETIAVEDLTNYNVDANRVEEHRMVLKWNSNTNKWDKLPEDCTQDQDWLTLDFNTFDKWAKYRFNNCIVTNGHPAMLHLDKSGKVHGVLEVIEAYGYNSNPTSNLWIVFQRFTTTNAWRMIQFTRRKAFWHNGTWSDWTMEQTSRQSVNRWKTYAFFGGSVCYNWNPFPNDDTGYSNEEILGVNSIRKRAISGAGWVAGNKIDNQITTELAETNPADVWVFWSSTNDHTAQAPIGDLDHKTDTTTVIGAMCNAIERVRTAKPTANILMTTPIRRFNNESGWNPYYDDGTTIPFYKYAEAVYTVANYYGIPVFDLWNNSGIDIKNYTTYMSDTIHPNASGYALFSRELCKFCADGHTGNSMPVIPEMKTNLVDLEDTNITNPQDWDVIKYDATTQKYVNAPDEWGLAYTPTSPYKPKYHRVGTQAQYDALSQYYTEQENDTMYFTI